MDPGAAVKGRALALLLGLLAVGCAHTEPDIAVLSSSSDRAIYEAGEQAFQKKQWENARKHFKRIIDGFPQSEYAPAARLGLADSYFKEGGASNWTLAIASYRDFLTLYPSHPKSDYAQFQVAEGYFLQRNKPDRDQTETERALAEYQRLLDVYPASPYVDTARGRIRLCRQSLAKADFQVGYFYQRTRKAYRAAVTRYEIILSEYPDYADMDEVLFRMAQALAAAARQAEALPLLGRLLAEYPQSKYGAEAKRLQGEIQKATPALPPPASPETSPPPSKTPLPSPTPP